MMALAKHDQKIFFSALKAVYWSAVTLSPRARHRAHRDCISEKLDVAQIAVLEPDRHHALGRPDDRRHDVVIGALACPADLG